VLVRRAERVKPDERQADNPMYVGDVLIYPNLGEPVRWSQEKALTFYVVVIPARGAVPRAMLEIVGGGRHLRRLRSTCLPLIRPAESPTSRK
jgi:hypothetical protein